MESGETLIDPCYNQPGICLSEREAEKRAELVSDIEYNYSLALNYGDFYLGQAEINFYLEVMPEDDEVLFLNSNALAIS